MRHVAIFVEADPPSPCLVAKWRPTDTFLKGGQKQHTQLEYRLLKIHELFVRKRLLRVYTSKVGFMKTIS